MTEVGMNCWRPCSPMFCSKHD